jgi:hypothetical protein
MIPDFLLKEKGGSMNIAKRLLIMTGRDGAQRIKGGSIPGRGLCVSFDRTRMIYCQAGNRWAFILEPPGNT